MIEPQTWYMVRYWRLPDTVPEPVNVFRSTDSSVWIGLMGGERRSRVTDSESYFTTMAQAHASMRQTLRDRISEKEERIVLAQEDIERYKKVLSGLCEEGK